MAETTLRRARPSRLDPSHWDPSRINPALVSVAVLLAAVGVVLTGLRTELAAGVTVGCALALATVPLWFGVAARYRFFVPIAVLATLSTLTGVWLTIAHSATYEVVRSGVDVNTALLAGIVLGGGFLLWLRPVLSEWQLAALFGLGFLAAEVVRAAGSSNPWKQHWSLPVTVLALALAQLLGRRLPAVLILLGLAWICVLNDTRSLTTVLIMTAVVVALQSVPLPGIRLRAARLVALLLAVGLAAYWLFSRLALSGSLGLSTKLRTEEQLQRSGSVLLGGRPEMAASLGLFERWPLGFGSGTILDPAGVATAQEAMAAINYDGNNGYVTNYMFGWTIELHSGIGDLWAWFGLPGLALAGLFAWVLLDGLARRLSERRATALQVFVVLITLWNFCFGPLYSVAPLLTLGLGLLLVPRDGPGLLGTLPPPGAPRFLGVRRFLGAPRAETGAGPGPRRRTDP